MINIPDTFTTFPFPDAVACAFPLYATVSPVLRLTAGLVVVVGAGVVVTGTVVTAGAVVTETACVVEVTGTVVVVAAVVTGCTSFLATQPTFSS